MTTYVQDPNEADSSCPHDFQICMDCGSVIYVAPHLTDSGTFTSTNVKTIHKTISVLS